MLAEAHGSHVLHTASREIATVVALYNTAGLTSLALMGKEAASMKRIVVPGQ
jgi:hypothetical protein